MNAILKNSRQLSLFNLVFYALTVVINYLGASGFFNGMDQATVSDKYLTLITPAGFTFSIWGVIYALLLVSLIFLYFKSTDNHYAAFIRRFSMLFCLNCLLNCAWVISFSYEALALSLVLIVLILLTLTEICLHIRRYNTTLSLLLPGITFGIYSGWVTIATVVNAAAWLVKVNWNGFGIPASTWSVVVLIASVVIVFYIANQLKNAVYALPIAWAYVGIYMAQRGEGIHSQSISALQTVLLVGIALLLSIACYILYRNHWRLIGVGGTDD